MPKRKSDETKEDRWLRKKKKYEDKLNNKRKNRIIYSSDEDDEENADHLIMEDIPIETDSCVEIPSNSNDQLPTLPTPDETNPATQPDEEVDMELLQTLGELEPEAMEWGEDVHDNIAKRYQITLANGLKKDIKEELGKKYLFPKNVPLCKAPTLNPEIATLLFEQNRNRDKTIMTKQDQLGKALSALGTAMSSLIKKNPDIPVVLRTLNDCSLLLADSHYAESYTRRSLIIPLVDKALIEPLKERKRDSLLFGENLGQMVQNSRGIKRTSNLMQGPSTSTSSLNWKRPPVRPFQPRTNTYQPVRAGGRPAAAYSRRGRATLPAATAARRPPPPPPPPPQAPARRQTQTYRRQAAPPDRHIL
ncbi:uncharacterized protein LOC125491428 [Plutella xylostella]|uniref:uncharacterized protein LOC125491428 n=1 Tax=Plutella xylostella TaxID=51655 RepID=UPI002032849C|nr:uncharacterized protein LOC125491428 [Plutella xylostella]